MILLETNWNRPLAALAMICATVMVCFALWALARRTW
jgi:hypothetical protein